MAGPIIRRLAPSRKSGSEAHSQGLVHPPPIGHVTSSRVPQVTGREQLFIVGRDPPPVQRFEVDYRPKPLLYIEEERKRKEAEKKAAKKAGKKKNNLSEFDAEGLKIVASDGGSSSATSGAARKTRTSAAPKKPPAPKKPVALKKPAAKPKASASAKGKGKAASSRSTTVEDDSARGTRAGSKRKRAIDDDGEEADVEDEVDVEDEETEMETEDEMELDDEDESDDEDETESNASPLNSDDEAERKAWKQDISCCDGQVILKNPANLKYQRGAEKKGQ